MKKEAFSAFDAADYLKSEEDIAAYLEAATEDGDPQILFAAMGDVVKARNVSRVARKAGLTREGIYKALSPEGNPSFATVWKVANALNIRFAFRAEPKARELGTSQLKGSAPVVHAKVVVKRQRGSSDRIDIDDPENVRYWTKALGVTSTKLKSAVKRSSAGATTSRSLAKGSSGRGTGR